MRGRRRQDAGFTLMELMIVMMIIGVLTTLAIPSFVSAVRSAKEAVLKEDLRVMRTAIDSYTMDKQKAPQSLDDLVQDGYLKAVPEDPMTNRDTWVTDTSDSLHSLDQTDPVSTTCIPVRKSQDLTGSLTPRGKRERIKNGSEIDWVAFAVVFRSGQCVLCRTDQNHHHQSIRW